MRIHNIDELRAEIVQLKHKKKEQELAIKKHFSSPSAIIGTLVSTVKHSDAAASLFNLDEIIGMVSRLVLPVALNKTIFRKSNFITKAVVAMLSQQASGLINESTIVSVWETIKDLTAKVVRPKKKEVDYGIPPFSETA